MGKKKCYRNMEILGTMCWDLCACVLYFLISVLPVTLMFYVLFDGEALVQRKW